MNDIKIVITTKTSLRHQVFLSKAAEEFGGCIEGVFLQEPHVESGKVKKKSLLKKILKYLLKRFKKAGSQKNYETMLSDLFGLSNVSNWKELKTPIFKYCDINGKDALEKLREISPDLILVFGGSILKGEWLCNSKYGTINMHYGILPFYRSSRSTEFSIFQENYDNVGATIHYIDEGVDTGAIISRHLVDPKQYKSFDEVLSQVYFSGLNALIESAKKIINTKTRLVSKIDKADNSYYSSKVYSQKIRDVVDLRLRLFHKHKWPYLPNAIQNKKNSRFDRIKLLINCKRHILRNGVYVFLYHSIVDRNNAKPWEKHYSKVLTYKNDFEEHIKYLQDHAEAVKLSEVPLLLRTGNVDKPYYVITFDDAYSNILSNAMPVLEKTKVFPTIFVNGSFSNQNMIYFRVMAAILSELGFITQLKTNIEDEYKVKLENDVNVFSYTKNNYRYAYTEKAILKTWQDCCPENTLKDIHLDWDGIKQLILKGCEIGNHTLTHPSLSKLNYEEQKIEIEKNVDLFKKNGICYIKWLSYPNGSPKDVNEWTLKWLGENPEWNGIFVNGGVNIFPSKTEWLRIPVGDDSLNSFKRKICLANIKMDNLFNESLKI